MNSGVPAHERPGLTVTMRLLIRMWAGNRTDLLEAVVLIVHDRMPQREVAGRVGLGQQWVGRKTREFFETLGEAAKAEGISGPELGKLLGVTVEMEEEMREENAEDAEGARQGTRRKTGAEA
jgi:hypothetical protein